MRDPERYANRVIDLHGGHDRFFQLMEERLEEFNRLWRHDSESIGRVLHAHLATEHFLSGYLVERNPGLGSLENARLSFHQKVELLPDDELDVSFLKPGLRQLNQIRNRVAHNLRVDVTQEDRSAFLGIQLFAAMRKESAKAKGAKADDPLSVLWQFAMFAASLLHAGSNPDRDLWRQAAETDDNLAQQKYAADGAKGRR